jgi:hypothetical protein
MNEYKPQVNTDEHRKKSRIKVTIQSELNTDKHRKKDRMKRASLREVKRKA